MKRRADLCASSSSSLQVKPKDGSMSLGGCEASLQLIDGLILAQPTTGGVYGLGIQQRRETRKGRMNPTVVMSIWLQGAGFEQRRMPL